MITGLKAHSESITIPNQADTTPPSIIGPPDASLQTGGWVGLSWQVQDPNPGNYTIYRNSTKVSEGLLTDNIIIEITVSSLGVGVYNFTFQAEDSFGNKATDLVYVTVFFKGKFSISSPPDIT